MYLCIPATSTPSERCFSTAGLTVTEKRANLDPDTIEKLIFIKENIKLLPKDIKELLKLLSKK